MSPHGSGNGSNGAAPNATTPPAWACPPGWAVDDFLRFPTDGDGSGAQPCTISLATYLLAAAVYVVLRLVVVVQVAMVYTRHMLRRTRARRRFPLNAVLQCAASAASVVLVVAWPHATATSGVSLVLFSLYFLLFLPSVALQAVHMYHFATKVREAHLSPMSSPHQNGHARQRRWVRSDPVMLSLLAVGIAGILGLSAGAVAMAAAFPGRRAAYQAAIAFFAPMGGIPLAFLWATTLLVRSLRLGAAASGKHGGGGGDSLVTTATTTMRTPHGAHGVVSAVSGSGHSPSVSSRALRQSRSDGLDEDDAVRAHSSDAAMTGDASPHAAGAVSGLEPGRGAAMAAVAAAPLRTINTTGLQVRLVGTTTLVLVVDLILLLVACEAVPLTAPIAFTVLFSAATAELIFLSVRLQGRRSRHRPPMEHRDAPIRGRLASRDAAPELGGRGRGGGGGGERGAANGRRAGPVEARTEHAQDNSVYVRPGERPKPHGLGPGAGRGLPKLDIGHDTLAALVLTPAAAAALAGVVGSAIVSSLVICAVTACLVIVGASFLGIVDPEAGLVAGAVCLAVEYPLMFCLFSRKVMRLLLTNSAVLLRTALFCGLLLCMADVVSFDERVVGVVALTTSAFLPNVIDAFCEEGELYKPTLSTLSVAVLLGVFAMLQGDVIVNRRATVLRVGAVSGAGLSSSSSSSSNAVGYAFNTYQGAKDASFALVLVVFLDLVTVSRNFAKRAASTARHTFLLRISAPIRVRVKLLEEPKPEEAPVAPAEGLPDAAAGEHGTARRAVPSWGNATQLRIWSGRLVLHAVVARKDGAGNALAGEVQPPSSYVQGSGSVVDTHAYVGGAGSASWFDADVDAGRGAGAGAGAGAGDVKHARDERRGRGGHGGESGDGDRPEDDRGGSFYEETDAGAKRRVRAAWTDVVVLDEADSVAAKVLGKERAAAYLWYACHPLASLMSAVSIALGMSSFILSLVGVVPKETCLLMLVPVFGTLLRMLSFYSVPMLRLLLFRVNFMLEMLWTLLVTMLLCWALTFDVRMVGFLVTVSFFLTWRLQDARACYPHASARSAAYADFHKSRAALPVKALSLAAAVVYGASLVALPLVFALGAVQDMQYAYVAVGPHANASVVVGATGSISPPQGTMQYVPLNQFASDMMIGWSVSGLIAVAGSSTVKAAAAGRAGPRRRAAGHVVLTELSLPVEPVYVA